MSKIIDLLTIFLLLFANNYQAIASVPDNLPQSPNIVFIMVDDLGWGDLKAFNPESKLQLPSIDKLAAEGRVFYDAHSPAAACAPSRYSMTTGNYTWRGRDEWGTWRYYGIGSQIVSGQWSFGDILKQAGYRTGVVGKSHLGSDMYSLNTGELAKWYDPQSTLDFSRPILDSLHDHGFDYSFLNLLGHARSPYAFFENAMLFGDVGDLIQWEAGQYGDSVIMVDGPGVSTWDTTKIEGTLLEKATQFIRQSNNAIPKTPFFLYLPTAAIHSPHTPPISIAGAPVRGESGIGDKGDMVHAVDVVVGQILSTLEEEGILNETLIIFTSDNGSLVPPYEIELGHDGSGGLRGRKTLIYEGGHRVPLIVKWGDGSQLGSFISPGSSSNVLISTQDFTAILAQLVGVELPQDQARDSFNMTSALFADNNDEQLQRDHLLTISNRDFNALVLPKNEFYYAIREGGWKLIVHYKQLEPDNVVPVGLYNLSNDLKETTDLVNDPLHADRVQEMVGRFKYLHATSRTAPIFVFDLDGDTVADNTDNCKFDFNTDQLDTDVDNFGDACDAFPFDPTETLDFDGDNIGDNADNCTQVPNFAQRDTDTDGYGNYCDPDFDNNLTVNAGDLGYMKLKFFTANPHADLNGSGTVNAEDLAILKSYFFKPPGPSGLVP